MSKTIAFATVGCRLNQAETQEMEELLASRGYRAVPFDEPAQVYVINTCTVTGRADFSDRQMIRRAIRRNPQALVVVTGCYAQTDPAAIARIPGVDLIAGSQEKYELAGLLDSLTKRATPLVRVGDIRKATNVPVASVTHFRGRSRAFVKVQDGCQHRCAFCIVPLARGGSRSREPKVVVDQVHRLVEAGYGEVVLTGVDMGHYGRDLFPRTTLAALLGQILDVPGLGRLRLSSILPSYFTDELIEVLAGSPRIAPHLHVPLQSGSDRVLRLMRRPYNTRIYASLAERLSRAIPDLGLGADVIVGFPGETDADFAATRALIGALPVSYLHVFSYSDRKGTEAARLPGHLPARTITGRSTALRRLGRERSLAFRGRLVGRTWEVLALEERDEFTGRLTGLTGNYVEVLFEGTDEWMGRFLNISVTDATSDRTLGKVAEPSSEA
ncbi:MAG: tRNA (N(6)-L-threonylcarbamoyladenosine(37)-C(2))-methylthiotransferase MtaB [Candidatus Rokubacteria bacterium]|nr:tRNA (N(6)-L-threonylcarbamoyladenosine(37)-C(2))-methylthiotransferase MtaB [Candidatus Rokubacteria bacterium]